MSEIKIYKGNLDEVIEMIKKDIENEARENKDMVDN